MDYELRPNTWADPADEIKAVRKVRTPKSAKSAKSGKSTTSRATSDSEVDSDTFLSRAPTIRSEWGENSRPGTRASRTNIDGTVAGQSTISFHSPRERPSGASPIFEANCLERSDLSLRSSIDRPHNRASNITQASSRHSTLSFRTTSDTPQDRPITRVFYGNTSQTQSTPSLFTAIGRTVACPPVRDTVARPPSSWVASVPPSVNHYPLENRAGSFNYGHAPPPSSFNDLVDKYSKNGPSASGGQVKYRLGPPKPQNQVNDRRAYTPSGSSFKTQNRSESVLFPRNSEWGASDRSVYTNPNLYLSDPDMLALGHDGYEGPDGFLKDNDADRAERAGFEPDCKFPITCWCFNNIDY